MNAILRAKRIQQSLAIQHIKGVIREHGHASVREGNDDLGDAFAKVMEVFKREPLPAPKPMPEMVFSIYGIKPRQPKKAKLAKAA